MVFLAGSLVRQIINAHVEFYSLADLFEELTGQCSIGIVERLRPILKSMRLDADPGQERCKNVPDYDIRPCSRSFRYKFRSLIPSILAAFPR